MEKKRAWRELTAQERLELREAYGHYLDTQPGTCSLDDKISRFQQWLEARNIQFDREDLAV